MTPLGHLAFFAEYLKASGRFDALVADSPLYYTSPNAPRKRDVLGTVLLSILAGHRRYAHITALRGDTVNAALLRMGRVVSEDAVRRGLGKIEAAAGARWLQGHLDDTLRPLLSEPWISRLRHHHQDALRPSRGRRGRLQPAQGRAARRMPTTRF